MVEETTRKELPIEAVRIEGTHNQFAIDEVGVEKHYNSADYGFSAIDLNLWLESNAINDALALKWDGLQGLLDKKKLSVVLIVGIIALVVVYVMMSGVS